jgi:hypothetical protein
VTTLLSISPNPAVFGQPITLTATVKPTDATGSITFMDGAATLSTEPIENGAANLVLPAIGAGAHALSAIYSP